MNKKYVHGLILAIVFFVFLFLIQIYLPNSRSSEEYEFFIKKGESVSTIANNLKEEGLIRNESLFKGYAWITKNSSNLKSGRYILSKNLSLNDIVLMFVNAKTQGMEITLIEGWDQKDISEYFEKKHICTKKEFLDAMDNFSEDIGILKDKPKNMDLEGYIFPDTYKLGDDFNLNSIIKKTVLNLDKKINEELRQEIEKRKKTIFEIITMASLIEKEVIAKKDKEIVSGILWKRLDSDMPLQVDATINYLSGKDIIYKEDLGIDSLYNTYKYLGLPPGPICNPGLDSIIAAVYPQKTAYWYYLSRPDKTTVFSKTLKEHNIARARYIQ
ncbi:MAG: endolytic transglycosylase MltG [Candidatus Pacebacteria bacterium]|nr:endolytic transglycosylase MltG [Candidatus Paceibacterota bacterium]MDD5621306.1 endolytic transglycosylase MltG [Candidatus Paceibacterota bacterium]